MDDLIERLSDAVHQAWMAEKLQQGYADHAWKYDITLLGDAQVGDCFTFDDAGRRCRIAPAKHHTDMLPYADLPENIKEYDRVTVRSVLNGIEAEGYAVLHRARQTSGRATARGE